MAALLSVLWSSLRQSNELGIAEVEEFPITSLANLVRNDFQNARGVSVDASGITLQGFLGSDPATGLATMTPARVRYEIQMVGKHSVLVRRDSNGESINSGVCRIGVQSILFEPLSDSNDESSDTTQTGGLPPIPVSFRITLVGTKSQILFREVIHHHAE